jgi:hypothetical protein
MIFFLFRFYLIKQKTAPALHIKRECINSIIKSCMMTSTFLLFKRIIQILKNKILKANHTWVGNFLLFRIKSQNLLIQNESYKSEHCKWQGIHHPLRVPVCNRSENDWIAFSTWINWLIITESVIFFKHTNCFFVGYFLKKIFCLTSVIKQMNLLAFVADKTFVLILFWLPVFLGVNLELLSFHPLLWIFQFIILYILLLLNK